MSRQPIGLHAPTHLPDGQDPLNGLLLKVTDGLITVAETTELDIGHGLVLTNPSPGVAAVALPGWVAYTPALTAATVNPTLGSGAVTSGNYTRLGDVVHVRGSITFGSSPAMGTGAWKLSLPVGTGDAGSMPQGRAYIGHTLAAPGNTVMWFDLAAGSAGVTLLYNDTLPIGTLKEFDSTSGWTLTVSDALLFDFHYKVV